MGCVDCVAVEADEDAVSGAVESDYEWGEVWEGADEWEEDGGRTSSLMGGDGIC